MGMTGKLCLVTGSSTGIGKATALGLAKAGAHVVLVARDSKRGEDAKADIIQQSGNENVELLLADLSTQAGVRALAADYLSRHDQLHVLINNVGGTFKDYQKSADGVELTMALNYNAPFLLTHLLLDTMKNSGLARIINVSSAMQANSLDIDQLLAPTHYKSMKVYGASKLAVVMFTYTLARQLEGTTVTVNALHPGVIYTPQATRMVPPVFWPLLKLFMSSPEKGAQPSLKLATESSLEGVTGQYYNKLEHKQTSPFSNDIQQQEKLYERSLAWNGLQ